MIQSGLTRKIDGMGRLVIPKEIRQKYNIHENDYLEFFIDKDSFYLKKYSTLGKLSNLAQELTDILNKYLGAEVLIAEKDTIIAYSGIYRNKYINKVISKKMYKSIKRREDLFEKYNKELEIIDGDVIICSYINKALVADYEETGIICLYRENKSVDEIDLKIVNIVASFLTKYIED